MEQAFRVPSVQSRLTSSVQPSSKYRLTGLPTIATPTIFSPVGAADGKLVARDRPVMAVVLRHKGVCLFQRNRANFKHWLLPPAGGGRQASFLRICNPRYALRKTGQEYSNVVEDFLFAVQHANTVALPFFAIVQ